MLNNEKSKWIWLDNNSNVKDQMVYIRKEIFFEGTPDKIRLYITASNRYKVFVDAELLGIGPCPGDPALYYYDTYEIMVSEDMRVNKSLCISAICYNIGESVTMITEQTKGKPGLRCLLEITSKSVGGKEEIKCIGSDESFKVISAPTKPGDFVNLDESRISRWSGFKEVYDSRNEPVGWKKTGFDDRHWNSAVIATETVDQYKKLIPREIPYMTDYYVYPENILQVESYLGTVMFPERLIHEVSDKKIGIVEKRNEGANTQLTARPGNDISEVYPAIIDASIPGSFPSIVLDFGREVVGYPLFTIKGMKGANVSFWYGESLDLYRYDTLILSGEKFTYEPYQIRAFRYLKIVCNNSLTPIEIYEVKLRMWRFPYEDKGKFECSDSLLNSIWETSTYTVKMNSLEHFVDCPLREQAQWLADSRVMAMSDYWVFNSPELVRKTIRQFLAVQTEDGFIPATGPQNCTLTNMDFPCHFFMMCYEYYFYTEDLEFMKEIYERLGRLLAFFESTEDNDGFITDKNLKGFFLDWAFIDKREQVTAAQCLFYQALKSYEKIADALGYSEKAEMLAEKTASLREKINSLLFNSEKGLYCDCRIDGAFSEHYSQQSSAYALITGVAKSVDVPSLIDRIFSAEGIEQIKGAFLLSFVTAMLFENGYSEKSIDIIRDYWGEMLKRGATTWWETFDRQTPSCTIPYCFAGNSPTYLIEYIPTSHCHAWGSGPAYTLPSSILGIVPLEPGFKKIKIQPSFGDLSWCKGSIPTKYGTIQAKWTKTIEGIVEYNIIEKPDEIEIEHVSKNVNLI